MTGNHNPDKNQRSVGVLECWRIGVSHPSVHPVHEGPPRPSNAQSSQARPTQSDQSYPTEPLQIRNPQSAIHNPTPLLDIIYEDADLLVVNKPAGLVCHPTKNGELSSLIGRARLYLGAPAFLVNRLDRETTGVTVLAKSSAVAGEMGKLWENRAVRKEYIAIVHGAVRQDSGAVDLPLGKDVKSQIAIKDCARPDGAAARTEFLVERRFQRGGRDFSLLRLLPRTGRKHQIRIHLAALGHPIVGDKLYGGNEDLYLALAQDRLTARQKEELILPNHALHADLLGWNWRGAEKAFRAPPNADFTAFAESTIKHCVPTVAC